MANWQTSLEYLEKAIKVTAFGTEAGCDAVKNARFSGADPVEIGMRYASSEQKAEWRRIAEPLTTCGISEIETRAKQIIGLCVASPRGSGGGAQKRWWQFWK